MASKSAQIVEALGGIGNIERAESQFDKAMSIQVADSDAVTEDKLTAAGADSVTKVGQTVTFSIDEADGIASDIQDQGQLPETQPSG